LAPKKVLEDLPAVMSRLLAVFVPVLATRLGPPEPSCRREHHAEPATVTAAEPTGEGDGLRWEVRHLVFLDCF
jgi:hypothetical protein